MCEAERKYENNLFHRLELYIVNCEFHSEKATKKRFWNVVNPLAVMNVKEEKSRTEEPTRKKGKQKNILLTSLRIDSRYRSYRADKLETLLGEMREETFEIVLAHQFCSRELVGGSCRTESICEQNCEGNYKKDSL